MRQLPYGTSNFRDLRLRNNYYVDKTEYIEQLENAHARYVFLLRPRRFGKSLFVSMLEYYYGIPHKEEFEQLFSSLHIGQQPTIEANSYMVLSFDFSRIHTDTKENTMSSFLSNVRLGASKFLSDYKQFYTDRDIDWILGQSSPDEVVKQLFGKTYDYRVPHPIYVLIDEYDHFANELLAFNLDNFMELVGRTGFVRKFYEAIKTATRQGVVGRFFGTGVSPITLDSLTSGFNITKSFSTRVDFNAAMGFTEQEVKALLAEVAHDMGLEDFDADSVMPDLRNWYNGYLFHKKGNERMYNSDMVLYFITEFAVGGFTEYPEILLDTNVASDYAKLQKMFNIGDRRQNYHVLEELLKEGRINGTLTRQFSLEKRFDRNDFISLLFYLGYVSIKDNDLTELIFTPPNFVIRSLFYDYFAELVRIEAQLGWEGINVTSIVKQMAQENDTAPFIKLVEDALKGLSNRDFVQFDEKYIKVLFTAFANLGGIYYVKSELEIDRKYPDVMLLYRPPYWPKYQFVFELKYLKKKQADQLEAVTQAAKEQLRGYLQSKELYDFVVRPEAGMETMKGYVVVFVGAEAKVVEEVNIKDVISLN